MDAETALLAALHHDPADEVAWLALADRLEEHGRADEARWHRLLRRLRATPEGEDKVERSLEIQAMLNGGLRPAWPRLTNSVGMGLTLVPAGTFLMGLPNEGSGHGSDEQLHEVELTRPFYFCVDLVTQVQYRKVTRKNPSSFRPRGDWASDLKGIDHNTLPVDSVSWEDAVAFCEKLSARKQEKAAKRTYRLATEAEWEYACRAWGASTLPFHFGMQLRKELAWYDWSLDYDYLPEVEDAKGPEPRTNPVGQFPPNAFGLYDVHGNVYEWCHDLYHQDYYLRSPRQDPRGPEGEDGPRVLRGGAYVDWETCRSAYRCFAEPGEVYYDRGFRVACEWRPPG